MIYDEVFADGQPRPHYAIWWRRYAQSSHRKIIDRSRAANREFHHDAPVFAFPRILTQAEYRLIAAAVAQRGRALQLFLRDHYFGKKTYRDKRLIGSAVLRRILKRHDEKLSKHMFRSEQLQFWYAPDIIREPSGQFRILEDNVGFVGGIGDLGACAKAAKHLGLPPSLSKAKPDPMDFYRRLASEYKRQAKAFGPGEVVMLSYHPDLCDTHEDMRFEAALSPLGIRTVRLGAANYSAINGLSLQARKKNIYLCTKRRGKVIAENLVSFVILNMDTADVEPGHALTKHRFAKHQIPGLDTEGVSGFWAAVKNGSLGVSTLPGLEFINDKEFYMYVDKLIAFYLKNKPILPNLETKSFAKPGTLGDIFSARERWVIKGANGQGGAQVWIGPKLSTSQAKNLQRQIARDPGSYVAQRFAPLSVVLDHHVDLRLYALIGPRPPILSRTPWGRTAPVSGNGKMNVSNAASLSIVLVED